MSKKDHPGPMLNIICIKNYMRQHFTTRNIIIAVCVTIGAIISLSFLNSMTYVWQCTSPTFTTVVTTLLRVPRRRYCDNSKAWYPVSDESVCRTDVPARSIRIAILSIYDNGNSPRSGGGASNVDPRTASSWNEDLMKRILKNRRDYCKMHGYDFILANDILRSPEASSRPAAWSKLLALHQHLLSSKHPTGADSAANITTGAPEQYDYILYMDMDVVIMNPSIRIEDSFLPFMSDQQGNTSQSDGNCIRTTDIDFLLTEDWGGVNTGVWLVRNSQWSRWFLREAWFKGAHLVQKYCPVTGIPYPFEYEQRAIHFLLDTDVWQRRALPKYRGSGKSDSQSIPKYGKLRKLDSIVRYRNARNATNSAIWGNELNVEMSSDIATNRLHFATLPQCTMNSYIMHPLQHLWRGNRTASQYVAPNSDGPGDFLIHFAGKKGQVKKDLMEYYLDRAEDWNNDA